MSAVKRVLIVGGGIGGLTAAIALRQAGISTDLVEVKKDWKGFGVGVVQTNNALRALGEIGVTDRCLEVGAAFPGWRICDANGNLRAEAANTNAGAPQYPPTNALSRPALHQILSGAARDHGASIRVGLTVSNFENRDGGVSVELSDGTRDQYDLLIGADGIYSQIRSMLFGEELKLHFTGQAVWRYNFARPKDMTWGMVYYGRKSKVGLVPMSATAIYLLLVTAEPGNPRMPADELHNLMRERLNEYSGLVAELAKGVTDPRDVVYKPTETLMVPSPWYRGRVLLIGDAAHAPTPHLGQGATIAIEDGVLIGRLLQQDQPLDVVLAEFMKRRFERCKFIVDTSFQLGEWEKLAWQERPDPNADPASVIAAASRKMAEPM
jgi:2-polyprenyl-6-methoxyphenol hydroxylase-like FAD-dependent oxidoreductase